MPMRCEALWTDGASAYHKGAVDLSVGVATKDAYPHDSVLISVQTPRGTGGRQRAHKLVEARLTPDQARTVAAWLVQRADSLQP